MSSLRTGDPADGVLLYQPFKGDLIDNLKEDKILNVLLQAYHNVALDIVQIQQRLSHACSHFEAHCEATARHSSRMDS
jgi:hypothetical protein